MGLLKIIEFGRVACVATPFRKTLRIFEKAHDHVYTAVVLSMEIVILGML